MATSQVAAARIEAEVEAQADAKRRGWVSGADVAARLLAESLEKYISASAEILQAASLAAAAAPAGQYYIKPCNPKDRLKDVFLICLIYFFGGVLGGIVGGIGGCFGGVVGGFWRVLGGQT